MKLPQKNIFIKYGLSLIWASTSLLARGQQLVPENIDLFVRNDMEILSTIPTIQQFAHVKEQLKISYSAARYIDSIDFISQGGTRFLVKTYLQDHVHRIVNSYVLYPKADSLFHETTSFSMDTKKIIEDATLFNTRQFSYSIFFKDVSAFTTRAVIKKRYLK